MFSYPLLFLVFFWDPYNSNVAAFDTAPDTILITSVLFILFTWFSSSEVISSILPSSSRLILLLPMRSCRFLLVLIPVTVLFVCLFFNAPRSLLIGTCIFSILFSRFLIICNIIILNSFSGSLPISTSFIQTSVFLVCSYICVAYLCLFIIFFFKLTVFEVSFSQVSGLNSFFLLDSALLRLVQWFVYTSYRVRFVLSFCLLFFLWWARLSEGVILSAGDLVCIVVYCWDEVSCTGCY